MAKAVAKTKKIAAKSKPSMPARAKAPPPASARKALKNSPAKAAPKPAHKLVTSKPAAEAVKSGKWVFTFGDGKAEGKAGLRDLLGGKGANLAEMTNLGLPVPPGFVITTEACREYLKQGAAPEGLAHAVRVALPPPPDPDVRQDRAGHRRGGLRARHRRGEESQGHHQRPRPRRDRS